MPLPLIAKVVHSGGMATGGDGEDVRTATPETAEQRRARFRRFLEEEIWAEIPAEERGKPITQAEQDEILGYGPDGYCV